MKMRNSLLGTVLMITLCSVVIVFGFLGADAWHEASSLWKTQPGEQPAKKTSDKNEKKNLAPISSYDDTEIIIRTRDLTPQQLTTIAEQCRGKICLEFEGETKKTYGQGSDMAKLYRDYYGATSEMCIKEGIFMGYTGADEELVIPQGVTEIAPYAMTGIDGGRDAANVKTLTIPDSVTVIGAYAFAYNMNLTQVNLGQGVRVICTGAFCDCGIREIILPESIETINSLSLGCANKKCLEHVVFEGTPKPVRRIHEYSISPGVAMNAFMDGGQDQPWEYEYIKCPNIQFTFQKSEGAFSFPSGSLEVKKSGKAYQYQLDLQWNSIEHVDGYEVIASIEGIQKSREYVSGDKKSLSTAITYPTRGKGVCVSVQAYFADASGQKTAGKKEVFELEDENDL